MQRRLAAAIRNALVLTALIALTGLHAKRKNRKPPTPPVGGAMHQNAKDATSPAYRPKAGSPGTYEAAPYHGTTSNSVKNKAPENGQEALDNSVPIKPDTTTRRVGIDEKTGEFVIFDEHSDGKYHGHVRSWDELSPGMRAALIKAGLVNKKGKII